MPYLTAAVVLVGVLGLANLLLVIALARRIRDLGSAPAEGVDAGHRPAPYLLQPGSRPSYFEAVTTAGETVTLARLAGDRALVGFFSAGCTPCHEQLPAFLERARSLPGGAAQVLAVVSGPPDLTAEVVRTSGLEEVASLVLERSRPGAMGPLAHAFACYGWPSFYRLGADGRVEAGGNSMAWVNADLEGAKLPR